MIAVLDNIRSIYNTASIFRTADGAGIEKLYLCGTTPTPINRIGNPRAEFAKVALGAEKTVPWEYISQTYRCIDILKKQGYIVYVIEQAKNSVPFYTVASTAAKIHHTALVIGNEIRGVSRGVLKRADTILEIPMLGDKESLNVSVTFGIVAYHFAVNTLQ